MRTTSPSAAILALWLCWIAIWTAASLAVKPSARRETMRSRLLHLGPLAIAVLLLWGPAPSLDALRARFVPSSSAIEWSGAVLVAAGLLFTVWARVHLGSNWSGIVTVKRDHELVTSGPYAIVRHPMYASALLYLTGTPLALASYWRLIPLAAMLPFLMWRLFDEERFLVENLPGYADYQQKVRHRLVPGVW